MFGKLIASCFIVIGGSIAFFSFIPASDINKTTSTKSNTLITLSSSKVDYFNTFSEDIRNREILVADVPENKEWWEERYKELESSRKEGSLSKEFSSINKDYEEYIDLDTISLNHVCLASYKSDKVTIKENTKYREDIGKYCTIKKDKDSIVIPYSINKTKDYVVPFKKNKYKERFDEVLVALDEENDWWWKEQDKKFFGSLLEAGTGSDAKNEKIGFADLYKKKENISKEKMNVKEQCKTVYEQDIEDEDYKITREITKFCSYTGLLI